MNSCKVFVGCIPGNTDQQELLRLLNKYGRVETLVLSTDKNKVNEDFCQGFAFATCPSTEDRNQLLEYSNRILYRGRLLSLRPYAVGSGLRENIQLFNQKRIFIGNVPPSASIGELKGIFSRFGSLENIYLVGHESTQAARYGYAIFHNPEVAQSLLSSDFDIVLKGYTLRIEPFKGKSAHKHPKPAYKRPSNATKQFHQTAWTHHHQLGDHIDSQEFLSIIPTGNIHNVTRTKTTGKSERHQTDSAHQATINRSRFIRRTYDISENPQQLNQPFKGLSECQTEQSGSNHQISIPESGGRRQKKALAKLETNHQASNLRFNLPKPMRRV